MLTQTYNVSRRQNVRKDTENDKLFVLTFLFASFPVEISKQIKEVLVNDLDNSSEGQTQAIATSGVINHCINTNNLVTCPKTSTPSHHLSQL